VKIIGLLVFLLSFSATAVDDFCQSRQLFLAKTENQLSFKNGGGLINGGVCWWHSRFTRNAAYLVQFRPELPRPERKTALTLIALIRNGTKPLTIPGFENLEAFSKAYAQEIQRTLEEWQLKDGIIHQQWVVGLSGKTSVPSHQLAIMMDRLYEQVAIQKDVVYQKLQLQGIDAHAWLVIGMEKNQHGYKLFVVDSNRPGKVMEYNYEYGMNHLLYGKNSRFVPYTERNQELSRLKNICPNA
jgi:hypothetical protein